MTIRTMSSRGMESYCQHLHMNVFRPLWRRKWYAVIILLCVIAVILIQQSIHSSKLSLGDAKRDEYMDGVYQSALNIWYNFTGGPKWYDGKILSPSDPVNWERYISHIRQNWILWVHNPNESYELNNPNVEDPSMGQANFIRNIFKDKKGGFFVECGAYDGETRSNTLVLERFLDWTGLLVEADPMNFSNMLHKNRKAYLTPTCLAVKPYPSVVRNVASPCFRRSVHRLKLNSANFHLYTLKWHFVYAPDALTLILLRGARAFCRMRTYARSNSFLMANNVGRLHEPNDTDSHLPNSPDVAHSGAHVSVQCFPFIHLMAALNVTTVNYFSLDIEGHELEVLKTIPFDMINIETLSVEFSHVENGKKELIAFMESKGYYVHAMVVRADKLAHDIIFVKNEFEKSSLL